MNKRKIKIHKGVDNSIPFKVFDQDKKCVDLRQLWLSATLVTAFRNDREKVFEKPCKLSSCGKTFTLDIQEGDLVDVAPGHYHLIVTAGEELHSTQVGEMFATPFYSDMNENIMLDVEIIESSDTTPVPSIEITWDKWTATGMDDFEQEKSQSMPFNRYQNGFIKYYTSAIPGNRIRNRTNATHTFSVHGTNLSGTLRVLATLDEIPQPNPNDYFMINITSVHDEIVFDEFSGTEAWTFSGNFTWLKFEFLPDYSKGNDWGEITKLIVRT